MDDTTLDNEKFKKMMEGYKFNDTPKPCPSCGRCPTCGHVPTRYPYYPYPIWECGPTVTYTTYTTT